MPVSRIPFTDVTQQSDNGHAWTNPGDAVGDDATFASISLGSGHSANTLRMVVAEADAAKFPADAVVTGVRLVGRVYAENGGARLLSAEGVGDLDNLLFVPTAEALNQTEDGYQVFAAMDLTGLQPGDLRDKLRDGFEIDVVFAQQSGTPTVYVSAMWLRIEYTVAVSAYAGPKMTLRPHKVDRYTPDDYRFQEKDRLIGAADGVRAFATMAPGPQATNDWSDSLLLRLAAPPELSNALVDGFKWTIKAASSDQANGKGIFHLALIDKNLRFVGAMDFVGFSQWTTSAQTNLTNAMGRQSTLSGNAFSKGPEDITLFSGGSSGFTGYNGLGYGNANAIQRSLTDDGLGLSDFLMKSAADFGTGTGRHIGNNISTPADLAGVAFRFQADHALSNGTIYTISVDTVELEVYYTPVAPGVSLTLAPTACSSVAGTDISMPVPDGVECAWTTASNALSVDTTVATSGVGNCAGMLGNAAPGTNADDVLGYTKFLKYSFAAGTLSSAIASGYSQQQLRLTWRGRSEGKDYTTDASGAKLDHYDFCAVHEVLLTRKDDPGTVYATLSDNKLYDPKNFKVGSYDWNPDVNNATERRKGERDRVVAIDVSHLSAETLGILNTEGYDIYIRWKLVNANNKIDADPEDFTTGTATFRAVIVNGIKFQWSYLNVGSKVTAVRRRAAMQRRLATALSTDDGKQDVQDLLYGAQG